MMAWCPRRISSLAVALWTKMMSDSVRRLKACFSSTDQDKTLWLLTAKPSIQINRLRSNWRIVLTSSEAIKEKTLGLALFTKQRCIARLAWLRSRSTCTNFPQIRSPISESQRISSGHPGVACHWTRVRQWTEAGTEMISRLKKRLFYRKMTQTQTRKNTIMAANTSENRSRSRRMETVLWTTMMSLM